MHIVLSAYAGTKADQLDANNYTLSEEFSWCSPKQWTCYKAAQISNVMLYSETQFTSILIGTCFAWKTGWEALILTETVDIFFFTLTKHYVYEFDSKKIMSYDQLRGSLMLRGW